MKKLLLAAAISTLSTQAFANIYGEFAVGAVSADVAGGDISHPVIQGSLGYNFTPEQQWQHKLEAMFGFGLGDSTVNPSVKVELENYYGLAYRPTYKLNKDWDLFARLAYAKGKSKATATHARPTGTGTFTTTASATSDWEFGYGVGVSYSNLTFAFTKIDDSDFFTAGYTFNF